MCQINLVSFSFIFIFYVIIIQIFDLLSFFWEKDDPNCLKGDKESKENNPPILFPKAWFFELKLIKITFSGLWPRFVYLPLIDLTSAINLAITVCIDFVFLRRVFIGVQLNRWLQEFLFKCQLVIMFLRLHHLASCRFEIAK